jgi:magnesium transporter
MNTDQIITEHFINTNINEAVQIIEKLDYSDIVAFIHDIPLDLAAKVLLHMNNYKAAKCLELLNTDIVVELIGNIDLLSTELLLRQCDEVFRNTLLDKIDPNIAEKIRQKLQYAVNSVGACMKLKVFSLQKGVTVSEAIELMKKERDLIASEIFVTDEQSRIEGIVKVTDLVVAEGTDQISSILTKDIPKIFADEPIQTIINHPEWIKYRTLPVIENSEALIGSLHFEDVLERNLKKDSELTKQMVKTGSALGELYWIGLTGLLQSVGNSD